MSSWPPGSSTVALLVALAGTASAAEDGAAPSAGGGAARVPSTVAIRSPSADDAGLQAAAGRIRAELEAAGVAGQIVECPLELGLADCGAASAPAHISLFRVDEVVTIDIVATLGDGLSLRRKVQVAVEPGTDETAVVAVRATELLRDLYLDVPRVSPPEAPPEAAPVVTARPPTPATSGRFSIGVSTGLAALGGRHGLGPSLAPVSALSVGIGTQLSILAAVGAPFSERLIGSVGTAANVRQGLAMIGARYELGQAFVRPYGVVGVGLHYLHVRGETTSASQIALTSSGWAALVAGGAGVSVSLGRWLFVAGEGALLFTEPTSNVTAGRSRVGTAGAPSFMASVSLGARLPLGK